MTSSTKMLAANYPSVSECLQYIEDFAMLDNIRDHSRQVARVAAALTDQLCLVPSVRELPERGLVVAGALLHDIAKTRCLREGCRHAEIGGQICLDLGFPEIAQIVSEHVIYSSFDPGRYRDGYIDARGLVYYADKRVLHDQVVSLDERLVYIIDRYGKKDPAIIAAIRVNFSTCYLLEDLLFSFLDFPPEKTILSVSDVSL
ncbi:HD domain-containing protein [Desulfotalea psychrophila]|nr:HD domain-containing protein [Desulfotalea psychrophila]